ncbi:MAG: hypothetical protein PWQ37_1206 [Candidatus Petromonas sp.]|jgi:hypothetical protein|nr:hypothetical protein [Candidatus Petromonas sp.]
MIEEKMKEDENYDATYYFGNSIVHIVAPKFKTPEEIEQILQEHHKAGWDIWKEILKKNDSNE